MKRVGALLVLLVGIALLVGTRCLLANRTAAGWRREAEESYG